jgi:hypothetical protein
VLVRSLSLFQEVMVLVVGLESLQAVSLLGILPLVLNTGMGGVVALSWRGGTVHGLPFVFLVLLQLERDGSLIVVNVVVLKDRYGEPGRGGEWEPIKILLEGDEDFNKTNTASNTRLRLTTQVGQAHVATGVPLDLATNTQPSEPKHTNTHSGNLHGLLPVPHRSDRWPAPVRPVTPVRPVYSAGQAGGYSSCTTSGPESLSDFSSPWNKTTPKTQPARKENPTQNLTKQLQTDQELTSITNTQRHTSPAAHLRQIPQKTCTGQTGLVRAAQDEQHPRVNSPKSKPRSPKLLHGLEQDFGDDRNTS